jgi:hypothetical protein
MDNNFPIGIKSITVKLHHRCNAYFWGLEYPLVFGELFGKHCCAVWNYKTGEVKAIFPVKPNIHDWSNSLYLARDFSEPYKHDPSINILHDLET